jgi:pyruvate-ferredoxin/flavodoxin oxidoreductase
MKQQKLLVDTGQWLLYRFDPRRTAVGENPLQLDSQAAKLKVQDFLLSENRFKMLTKSKPEEAKRLFELAQHDADARWQFYAYLAGRKPGGNGEEKPAAPAAAS